MLTDIAGMEDHYGDMDFKVAGTSEGVTALQMDIKIKGITYEIMEEALEQARDARLFILDKIREVIAGAAHGDVTLRAAHVPHHGAAGQDRRGHRPRRPHDPLDHRRDRCSIDIEDDGTVFIGSPNEEMAQKAISIIEGLTKDVELGETYTGTVTRLTELRRLRRDPARQGRPRAHRGPRRLTRSAGPKKSSRSATSVKVMVIEVDSMGRVNLSRRAVLEGLTLEEAIDASQADQQARGPRGGGRGGPRR